MKKENLTDRLVVRVSPSQKQRIYRYALKSGLEVSDYVRWLALQGYVLERPTLKQHSASSFSTGRASLEDYEGPFADRKPTERPAHDQEQSA